MKINYTRIGDYLIPNLTLNNDKNLEKINRYGMKKLNYLKENNKTLYTTLLMKDELQNYLLSVSNECEEKYKILINNYIKNDERLSEKNKENNQIEWVKLMNNYKNIAEEIILKELI
jgi:hypothetical protein